MTLVGIGQAAIAHRWTAKASGDESHGYHRYHKRERKKKQKRKRKCTTTTTFYTRKRSPCTSSPNAYSYDPGGSRLRADVGPISAPITTLNTVLIDPALVPIHLSLLARLEGERHEDFL